jgi:hypothetical protein
LIRDIYFLWIVVHLKLAAHSRLFLPLCFAIPNSIPNSNHYRLHSRIKSAKNTILIAFGKSMTLPLGHSHEFSSLPRNRSIPLTRRSLTGLLCAAD